MKLSTVNQDLGFNPQTLPLMSTKDKLDILRDTSLCDTISDYLHFTGILTCNTLLNYASIGSVLALPLLGVPFRSAAFITFALLNTTISILKLKLGRMNSEFIDYHTEQMKKKEKYARALIESELALYTQQESIESKDKKIQFLKKEIQELEKKVQAEDIQTKN